MGPATGAHPVKGPPRSAPARPARFFFGRRDPIAAWVAAPALLFLRTCRPTRLLPRCPPMRGGPVSTGCGASPARCWRSWASCSCWLPPVGGSGRRPPRPWDPKAAAAAAPKEPSSSCAGASQRRASPLPPAALWPRPSTKEETTKTRRESLRRSRGSSGRPSTVPWATPSEASPRLLLLLLLLLPLPLPLLLLLLLLLPPAPASSHLPLLWPGRCSRATSGICASGGGSGGAEEGEEGS